MTTFEFSIRAALKRAWTIFAKHYVYFLVLSLVMVVFNIVSKNDDLIPTILVAIASLIWSYVALSSSLAAVDGREGILSFDALKLHLPTFKQFFLFVGLALASMIFIGAGFILLVIPGIYFLVRLMFSNFAFIDRKEGIVPSMKYSWHLVKGDVFWTALLGLMVSVVMMFIGVILFGVGILVAYPLAMLFLAILYRELATHQAQTSAVVEQPKEIPPTPAPEPGTQSAPTENQ